MVKWLGFSYYEVIFQIDTKDKYRKRQAVFAYYFILPQKQRFNPIYEAKIV